MDELCPLCLKIGDKRKIKAIQVNLAEALWMCENEECPWPFGYETPEIFARKVGDKWSFEWKIYRKVRKSVGPIPVSTELSLYTPPVTPSGDAAAKDSAKTDLAHGNTSDLSNIVFSSNSSPRDSYAPRSVDNGLGSPQENARISKECDKSVKIVPFECKNDCTAALEAPSVLSSIFDIDGDKFLRKIGIKETSPDSRSANPMDSASSRSALVDGKNSEKLDDRLDAVLEESPKSEILIEKSLEAKKIINERAANTDPKEMPFVRSIAKTNIDLQRFTSLSIVKSKKVDLLEETNPEFPFDIAPVTPPSDCGDRLNLPKQRTTMITVEGIPPIILSYDLADLSERSETLSKCETIPVTSTPMQKRLKRNEAQVRNKLYEKKSEISSDLPEKQAKLSAKRRTTNGKIYEKFSFSALRKTAQKSRQLINLTNQTVDPGKEIDKVDDVNHKRQDSLSSNSRFEVQSVTSGFIASGPVNPSEITSTKNNSNLTDETLISANLDSSNSLANDGHSNESLNLSCLLDDMLLDGYQNATTNLNDDWLESFFT